MGTHPDTASGPGDPAASSDPDVPMPGTAQEPQNPAGDAVERLVDEYRAAERQYRRRFFSLAAPHTPLLGVDVGDATFLVATSDVGVGQSLFAGRKRGEMATLARTLRAIDALTGRSRRGTFVDVGANIGTTTVTALVRHGFERALAIEPSPETFRLLGANVALNGMGDRIDTVRAAVGSEPGRLEMWVSENLGTSSLHERAVPGPSRCEVVAVETLDGLARERSLAPEDVGMVWIDVQGHEGHVLAGAGSFLEAGVPLVLELFPAWLRAADRLDALIEALAANYTHVVDARQLTKNDIPRPAAPAVELRRIVDELTDTQFTDVLAVRVP